MEQRIVEFFERNRAAILADIRRLVAVDSVRGESAPGAPFGPGPRRALDEALAIAREHGLSGEIRGDRMLVIEAGEGEAELALLAHLDVVPPAGEWTVTRSRGDSVRNPGALRLHWTMPEVTDGGFAPTGRFVELAPELLPEVPEGVMMKIDTLLAQDVTARRAEDLPCEEVAE